MFRFFKLAISFLVVMTFNLETANANKKVFHTQICNTLITAHFKLSPNDWWDKLILDEMVEMTLELTSSQRDQILHQLGGLQPFKPFEDQWHRELGEYRSIDKSIWLKTYLFSGMPGKLILLHEFQHLMDDFFKVQHPFGARFIGLGLQLNERSAFYREYKVLKKLSPEQQQRIKDLPIHLNSVETEILGKHGLLDRKGNFKWTPRAKALLSSDLPVRIVLEKELVLEANEDLKLMLNDALIYDEEEFFQMCFNKKYFDSHLIGILTSSAAKSLIAGGIAAYLLIHGI